MLFSGQVADFGESKQFNTKLAAKEGADDLTLTVRGTFLYMAPEVLQGKRYNKSVDVFSFVIVLLVVAVGDAHYVRDHWRHKFAYVEGWRPPIPEEVHKELPSVAELIAAGWDKDPAARPSFLAIMDSLNAIRPSKFRSVKYSDQG